MVRASGQSAVLETARELAEVQSARHAVTDRRITMCSLYYADFWIVPTIGPERALTVAIAALESA